MRSTCLVSVLAAWGCLGLLAERVSAQQVTVSAPHHNLSDGFYERIGTHWGFNWKGLNFQFGGPNMATPPFGGFDPSAGLNTGFAFNRGGFNGFMNLSAGQGFRQSFTSQVPSVTLMNGVPGSFSDTSLSPFVISYIPVVGGFPAVASISPMILPPAYPMMSRAASFRAANPRVEAMRQQLAEGGRNAAPDELNPIGPAAGPAARMEAAQGSSAGRAAPSVADARRMYQSEQAAADGFSPR